MQRVSVAQYYADGSVNLPHRLGLILPRIRILRIGRPRMLTAIFPRDVNNTGSIAVYREDWGRA